MLLTILGSFGYYFIWFLCWLILGTVGTMIGIGLLKHFKTLAEHIIFNKPLQIIIPVVLTFMISSTLSVASISEFYTFNVWIMIALSFISAITAGFIVVIGMIAVSFGGAVSGSPGG